MSLAGDEIRSLLWDVGGKLRKEELYFRNQERLMQNAILPVAERQRRD